ncbi:MAG: ABC transporter permease [Chloroflexi bacterium]|nr:ABC transporter permease [Chloroflexota bacterium]
MRCRARSWTVLGNSACWHGLHQLLFVSFWSHDELVRLGDYDRLLVRPVHPILQVLTIGSSPADVLTEWLPSVTMLLIAAPHAHITWNLATVVFLLILILSGAVIEGAVSLFIATFGFWFTRTNNLRGIAHTFLFRVAHFPTHIYGRVFAFVLTFVFPYAFMAYYPTHVFFQIDVQIFSSVFPYLSPLVALTLLCGAMAFWRFGLMRYQSSGS